MYRLYVILPVVREWQARPLASVSAVVYLDAIHFYVRAEGQIVKKAVYIAIGLDMDGRRDVLGMYIGENERAKFWLSVLNELKNRGLKDIFVLCADGLSGIKEAISAVYPMTEYQRCIVHVVRNALRYVADKDKKAFATDLKTIYHAPDEEQGHARMRSVAQVWDKKYPGCWISLTSIWASSSMHKS